MSYKLSSEAAEDFHTIYEYGFDHFGLEQANYYMEGMEHRFQTIAETPLLYPAVNHIRKGYRRSVYGVHSIYYQIGENDIEIMRVIGRQTLEWLI